MHTPNVVVAWATAVHRAVEDARTGLGVDGRELSALTLVAEHEGCSLDWLRHRVGLTQSGTVRLVDRLAGRGLLEREVASGRSVPLRVTPAGRRVLADWADERDRAVDGLLAVLPDRQRDQLLGALRAAVQRTPRDRRTADATCGSCTWPACGSDCPVDLSVTDESA